MTTADKTSARAIDTALIAPSSAIGSTARNVLIVEDDGTMAELERRALSRAGFTPYVAASVADARDRLADGGFIACLLDYNLPDGDAWSLVALARGLRPRVPVLLVTAMGSEVVAAEAVRKGVAEYILKSDRFIDGLGEAVERAVRLADADEEMRRNNSLFRAIADNAHDAIVLLDGTGMILFASAATAPMLGETLSALIGRKLADFIHPEDRPAWPRDGRAPRHREPAGQVFRFQRHGGPSGSIEPVFATIGDGEATRTLGVLRDVTERVRLEERVRHQERMEAIGHLTGGLAHDFNNMLGVVIGNLDMLRALPGLAELVQELARDALEAALLGADLTHGLLAFARRQDLRPIHSDVNASVRSIVRLLNRVLGQDIHIELQLEDDVWPVSVDRAQLETALTNLAANARDAMPRGGRLVIATRNVLLDADDPDGHADAKFGDYAVIEVRDTGVGISPDVLGRIFEPFYTTKQPGKGTGLGLAMVFGFLRQSGGHIVAFSEIGQGTTFQLYFPRATGLVQDQPAGGGMPEVPGGHGRTVLVVEDNTRLRQITVRQLNTAGYRVLMAEGAAAAMALVDGIEAIDLLFTDVVMAGGIDGFDLAQLATARRPALKVLLTSGFPDLHAEESVDEVRSSHPLLLKPYRSDALLHAVSAALE